LTQLHNQSGNKQNAQHFPLYIMGVSKIKWREFKMKIVNGYVLMKYAVRHNFLLPSFNTTNLEMTYAIVKGLNKAKKPGYIQISSNNLRLSSPEAIAALTKDALSGTDMPISLHLDHGKTYEDVKRCVDAGFTSIMIDASHLSYEENIAATKKSVDYCHFYGIPVEAELGALRGKEEDIVNEADCKTDPDLVNDFVTRTGCDLLAVSIGNVHGLDIEPKIDIPLLKQLAAVCPVPLVMHGGSGVPFDIIRETKNYGMLKINYGSDLRKAFITTFGKAYVENNNAASVIELSIDAVENVSQTVQKITEIINR